MKIVYMGTGAIGIPTLSALLDSQKHEVVGLVTQPDRPAGRSLVLRPPPSKTLALARGIPVLQPEKLQKELQPLLALKPDLIVVLAYGQILPTAVLQLPKVACLNLHASLLPRHRGASPIQSTLLEGDVETGMTVIHMDEGLDTGDVFLWERMPVASRETAGQLHDRLAQVAPHALMKALALLEQGKAPRFPQDSNLATYAPKLTKEDARLHWQDPAWALDRRIRAMNPWPGAFCWWTGHGSHHLLRLRVLEAEPRECGRTGAAAPGEILHVGEKAGIYVQCSQGTLLLRQVHLEGRKCMSAVEFARGYSVQQGHCLK